MSDTAPHFEQRRSAHIGPFRDLVDANLAIGRLQDEGIDARLVGENLAATLGPIYGGAYAGGPLVLVSRADETRANAVIAEVERIRRERLNAETPVCPKCSQRASTPVIAALRWAGVATLVLTGFATSLTPAGLLLFFVAVAMFLWPILPVWRCKNCGQIFSAAKPTADENELDE